MKEFTFPAWCKFGPGDYGETEVEVFLNEEQAEILVKYGTQSDIYYGRFSKCKELSEIYELVYNEAVDLITYEVRSSGDYKCPRGKKWKADQMFECGVEFPKQFEKMFDQK